MVEGDAHRDWPGGAYDVEFHRLRVDPDHRGAPHIGDLSVDPRVRRDRIGMIIVHVRVVTRDKAWWMSVLSIFGFFVMLFNWIGVNYFLPGLHSYAG